MWNPKSVLFEKGKATWERERMWCTEWAVSPENKVIPVSVPFEKEDKERQIIFADEKLGKWSVAE